MLLSTSKFVGINCQTEPYSFVGLKPVATIAAKNSCHGISPGWSAVWKVWNNVENTLATFLLTMNFGWGSGLSTKRLLSRVFGSRVCEAEAPRVLTFSFLGTSSADFDTRSSAGVLEFSKEKLSFSLASSSFFLEVFAGSVHSGVLSMLLALERRCLNVYIK